MTTKAKVALSVIGLVVIGSGVFIYIYYQKHLKMIRANADATIVTADEYDTIINKVAKQNK